MFFGPTCGLLTVDYNRMKPVLSRAFTSLILILLVAFAARMAFAWDQQRKIPENVLGTVPFAQ